MNTHRLFRIAVACVLGLGVAALIAAYQIEREDGPARSGKLIELEKKNRMDHDHGSTGSSMAGTGGIGGPFTLTTDEGREVTHADFDDKYKLIFFGFTHCPGVCPSELTKMTKVLEALEPAQRRKIHPLFITVDPPRDTVEVMHAYLEDYHPQIIGLTGTQAQIDEVLDAYKIHASKVENEMMEGYMVNHSSFIYFMGPDDRVVEIFRMQESAGDLVKAIREEI